MALPGIAMSGYGMENDLAQSREAGFRFHLTKPVSFDRLQKASLPSSPASPQPNVPATVGAAPA